MHPPDVGKDRLTSDNCACTQPRSNGHQRRSDGRQRRRRNRGRHRISCPRSEMQFSETTWVGTRSRRRAPRGRLTDFAGLPGTDIEVGELDIVRDESVTFVQCRVKAGVSCELHILPGVMHGHDRMAIGIGIGVGIGVSRRTLVTRCRIIIDL
ncbi:alpha/beta hydrolase fold domain-containing protein [Rhodococcus sp. P-2]|uniref:alpha/beta hydrolase n=1 Tax=Rhodococcus sp. P-2 TaxID=2795031 RepID=UPI0019077302|nr:alpha/beta hydrolase fold domain-containing protein [Rhodococcus sp. P-2]